MELRRKSKAKKMSLEKGVGKVWAHSTERDAVILFYSSSNRLRRHYAVQ